MSNITAYGEKLKPENWGFRMSMKFSPNFHHTFKNAPKFQLKLTLKSLYRDDVVCSYHLFSHSTPIIMHFISSLFMCLCNVLYFWIKIIQMKPMMNFFVLLILHFFFLRIHLCQLAEN